MFAYIFDAGTSYFFHSYKTLIESNAESTCPCPWTINTDTINIAKNTIILLLNTAIIFTYVFHMTWYSTKRNLYVTSDKKETKMQLEGYANLFFFLVDSSHKIYFNSIHLSVFFNVYHLSSHTRLSYQPCC